MTTIRHTPEATTPARILQRALDNAQKPAPRLKQENSLVYEALREVVQPATIAELIVLFMCLIAPTTILFFSGE